MESRANSKGNPSSYRNPFPQSGFNLILNDGLLHNRGIPISDRLSLNLSSNPSSSFYDSSFDQFQDSRNVNESNPSKSVTSNNDTIQEECQQQIPLLNLFPQTPNDLLPNESQNLRLAESRDADHINGVIIHDARRKQPERGSKSRKALIKGHWTEEEDRKLIELVEKYGTKKWGGIALMIGKRIGKQCRERWENHLKHNFKKKNWTEEEEMAVIEAHKEVGSRWAEMAKRIPGRSQNAIKNLWNGTKRRLQNALRKGCTSSREFTPFERYIISSFTTNEEEEVVIVNATPTPRVDCELLDLNSEPEETSDQTMTMKRSSSGNREEEEGGDNSAGGGEMEMEEEHEEDEDEVGEDEDVYRPVFDDKRFGLSNDEAGRPDQPAMSEEAKKKEEDFMDLLLNSKIESSLKS